jgi:Insertion element 4 transposase N-terminal/Transposase DDE domain
MSVVSPDQVSLGVLVCAVSRDAIDAAVAACGVGERRSGGKLPAHVTAYLTMALSLFADDDYEEVATKVTGSLDRWGCWDASWSPPTSSAITQARKRLGRKVFAEVFEAVAEPVGGMFTRGATVRDWRVLAIDGFEVDLPDSDENAAEFGYAGSGDHRSTYPKARVVALSECGTHAFLAAEVAPYHIGERTLATRLYGRLRPDELLTADRGFYSFGAWGQAAASGAALLWRAPTQLELPLVRVLADGTYTAVLVNPKLRGARRERVIADADADADHDFDPDDGYLVRVIEYNVPDRTGNGTGELITLITTIVDPDDVRADDLADIYHQRWEHETGNDQLKTHLRGPGKVLRSRLPDLAYQEIWAWLTVHYAIAVLTARAAEAADIDPDRISFTRALRIIRRTATGTADISPSGLGRRATQDPRRDHS